MSCSNDNDPFVALEAVHFHQQLVEGLFALIMTAAQTGPAMPADRIDFIDEYDARSVLLRLLEHVADARGAHADEHFDEIRAGDGDKWHLRLAGDGARQQRLAGSGGADHEHAFRDLAAKFLELAGIFHEIDDFYDFLLRLFDPRHVGESDVDLIFAQQARPALAEGHGAPPSGCALHL